MNRIALLLPLILLIGGCSTQDLEEQGKIQQATNESYALIQQAWADNNMPEAQKVKVTAAIASEYAAKTGLITTAEKDNFTGVMELAWNTYWAWNPAGVPKMDITVLLGLFSTVMWLLKKNKK